MARADEPGFGAPSSTGSTRAQRPLDARDPRHDPRRAPPSADPRQDPRFADPRQLQQPQPQDPRYYEPRQPDPRQADPRYADPRTVPQTRRAAQPIQAAAEQSYVPQFDRYEPQRQPAQRTVRQPALPQADEPPRRPGAAARLDPSLFGPAAGQPALTPPAPERPAQAPPRAMAAPVPRQAYAQPPAARAPERAPERTGSSDYDDAYEPPFETAPARGPARGYDQAPAPAANGYPRTQSARPIAAQAQQPAQADWQDQHEDGLQGDDNEGYNDNEEEYEDDEVEQRPRSRRLLMVGGAIGIAVLLGAGVGLGYRMLGDGGGGESKAVLSAPKTPSKKAAEKTAETGKKTIFRIGEDTASTSQVAAAAEEPVAGAGENGEIAQGPRKVATVQVKPGDTIEASTGVGTVTSAEADVPGISLAPMSEDPLPAEPVAKVAKAAKKAVAETGEGDDVAAAANALLAKPAAAVKKKLATVQPEEELPVAEPVSQPVKKLKLAKNEARPAVMTDDGETLGGPALAAADTAEPALKAKPASGGQGFVAQVRASTSRVDALGSFADMQQRYGEVLGGAQPDIQEANLGAKGVWYRLRLGPPGSKRAAADMCAQLKAKGLKDCIVVGY